MRTVFGIAQFAFISLFAALPVQAETALANAYEQAWLRQPAAAAQTERQRAVAAQATAAGAWLAAPLALELGARSDRFNRNQGARELDVGIALPLWLPGERDGARAVAAAEGEVLSGRLAALRLTLAQLVREAWWGWQSARNEVELAAFREDSGRRLRDDVARRFQAGDLSRADFNQAEGAYALARAQRAEAEAGEALASYRLESLTGVAVAATEVQSEPEPGGGNVAEHPALRDWQGRAELARRQLELARTQSRANPELAIATRSDRAADGEPLDRTWALSLRLPFGGGARHDARVATANAEAIEAEIGRERERERIERAAGAFRQQVAAARLQLAAAEERVQLARDNRGFYEKSFRLGESDLPTRLRIEAEAVEAERALGRARLALALGISQLRQALGLLPE